MRKFTEILIESKKVYEFKIGIAGELPDSCEQTMRSALEKFQIDNMSAGKKTPIQERPLDFPQLQNMEVTYFEVAVNYPTTTQILQEYLGKCCGIDQSYIIVRKPGEPQEQYQQEPEQTEYDVLLTKEDLGGESAQESVAGNRVMDLLKELEVARKERSTDYVGDVPTGEGKDIDNKENSKSAVGS
jgi:hypothetical protein